MSNPGDAEKLQEILGPEVSVREINASAIGAGGKTIAVTIPGMNQQQADQLIDNVLMPARAAAGLDRTQIGFGAGDGGGFGFMRIEKGEVLVDVSDPNALAALAQVQGDLRASIASFARENGLAAREVQTSMAAPQNSVAEPVSQPQVAAASNPFGLSADALAQVASAAALFNSGNMGGMAAAKDRTQDRDLGAAV